MWSCSRWVWGCFRRCGLVSRRWCRRGGGGLRVPGLREVSLDSLVVLFTLGVCLFSAVLFGLAPMLQAGRVGPAAALKGSSGGVGKPGGRLRSALFVAEIAVAIVLTVGSGLLL